MSEKKRIAAIKGTKDILPKEARKWQRVEATAKRIFELYGYREIRTPIFEATELFEKGTGETSDIVIKEMYTFQDKAGRSLTLRPEYTPSIVRSIIEHRLHLQPDPLRFYFIGPMFRYDKPQKGRYRQFHQMDIEVFGEKGPAVDAENVEMADYLLKALKITETEILVNSVGCQECRPGHLEELKDAAEKKRALLCPDCQRKITTNPLRIFDCKVETCREAAREFPKITDFEGRKDVGHSFKTTPAQSLQDRQGNGVGGDDLRGRHPTHSNKDKLIDGGTNQPCDNQGEEDGEEVIEPQGIEETPDDESGDDIYGTMGEVGQSADSIDQGEPKGHEGQRETIYCSIDEYFHSSGFLIKAVTVIRRGRGEAPPRYAPVYEHSTATSSTAGAGFLPWLS